MKITSIAVYNHRIMLKENTARRALLIAIVNSTGRYGWGEIAPLPQWSSETVSEAYAQLKGFALEMMTKIWLPNNCFFQLASLQLLPSLHFALESALLSLLQPLPEFKVSSCALLMGSPEQVLKQASERQQEGYTVAKLKIGHLAPKDAEMLIRALKPRFRLRIDVNSNWDVDQSIHFFNHYDSDAFEYIEEPCNNPLLLSQFNHPVAIDESFPHSLSLQQIDQLPNLRALIYKPTLQGGIGSAIALKKWTDARNVKLIMSSCFESEIGIASVAAMAKRLELNGPHGLGTFHFLAQQKNSSALNFCNGEVTIPSFVCPSPENLLKLWKEDETAV